MARNVYYGNYGEYGPYTPQEEDGLPDAGEVQQDYRWRAMMSVKGFVEEYNQHVAEFNERQRTRKHGRRKKIPTITVGLVYKWEKYNMVPTDPDRRRIIASILKIPPLLLGLVTAQEILPKVQPTVPTVITHQSIDVESYEETARTFWRFHHTSTAQHEWYTISKTIKELEAYEQQFRGDLQRSTRELLYSYYLLAARIVSEDQGDDATSYMYANDAVRVAKSIQKDAQNPAKQIEMGWLVARAQYSRGNARLYHGLYETRNKQDLLVVDYAQIQDAIADFEEAEKQAAPGLKGNLYTQLARAQGFVRRSSTDITLAQHTIESAGNWIKVVSAEDSYVQNLLDGRPGGLTTGTHLLWTAITLDALGRSDEAIKKIEELENLKAGRIPSDYTRDNAWFNIVWAQAAFHQKDFYTATMKAKDAYFACRDIRSFGNIVIIQDIYRQLLTTSYKNEQQVKALGQLLAEHNNRGR